MCGKAVMLNHARFVFILILTLGALNCATVPADSPEPTSGAEREAGELGSTEPVERRPVDCRPLQCRVHCPQGFAIRDGCPVCMCADEEPRFEDLVGTPAATRCDPVHAACQLHCERYQRDASGCVVCACAAP